MAKKKCTALGLNRRLLTRSIGTVCVLLIVALLVVLGVLVVKLVKDTANPSLAPLVTATPTAAPMPANSAEKHVVVTIHDDHTSQKPHEQHTKQSAQPAIKTLHSSLHSQPSLHPLTIHIQLPEPSKPQESQGKSEDNTKDAVSNAMTALGTTIAVVTLLLTIGTTWLFITYRDIERLRNTEQSRLELLNSLAKAKIAILHWFENNTSNLISATRNSLNAGMHLEMLLASDLDVRRMAWSELDNYPWQANEQGLEPLLVFTIECYAFHKNNLMQTDKTDWRQMSKDERAHLWCKDFF